MGTELEELVARVQRLEDLEAVRATWLDYCNRLDAVDFVAGNRILIVTYQHRMRRDPDRWRFAHLRISVRYRGRLEVSDLGGQSLADILSKPF